MVPLTLKDIDKAMERARSAAPFSRFVQRVRTEEERAFAERAMAQDIDPEMSAIIERYGAWRLDGEVRGVNG